MCGERRRIKSLKHRMVCRLVEFGKTYRLDEVDRILGAGHSDCKKAECKKADVRGMSKDCKASLCEHYLMRMQQRTHT